MQIKISIFIKKNLNLYKINSQNCIFCALFVYCLRNFMDKDESVSKVKNGYLVCQQLPKLSKNLSLVNNCQNYPKCKRINMLITDYTEWTGNSIYSISFSSVH